MFIPEGTMTAPVLTTPAWEFTPEQSVIMARLAQRMRVVGIALMALAALLGLRAAFGGDAIGLLAVQAGIVLGCTGYWSVRAATELSRVVTTAGADVTHLMAALGEIRKLYELPFWLFLVAAVLLGATLLMAITGASWLPVAW
jgi:hypothetical protein